MWRGFEELYGVLVLVFFFKSFEFLLFFEILVVDFGVVFMFDVCRGLMGLDIWLGLVDLLGLGWGCIGVLISLFISFLFLVLEFLEKDFWVLELICFFEVFFLVCWGLFFIVFFFNVGEFSEDFVLVLGCEGERFWVGEFFVGGFVWDCVREFFIEFLLLILGGVFLWLIVMLLICFFSVLDSEGCLWILVDFLILIFFFVLIFLVNVGFFLGVFEVFFCVMGLLDEFVFLFLFMDIFVIFFLIFFVCCFEVGVVEFNFCGELVLFIDIIFIFKLGLVMFWFKFFIIILVFVFGLILGWIVLL